MPTVDMDKPDDTRSHDRKPAERLGSRPGVDAAFDIWLQRGLHALYDGVAAEPIPAELLKLIEEDRLRSRR